MFAVNGPCDMERTPCFNSTCIPNNYPPFYFCVDCAPGKTGFNCDQGVLMFNFLFIRLLITCTYDEFLKKIFFIG